MLGAGVEVFVRGGRLFFRCLSPLPLLLKGLPLHPDNADDPYVFRFEIPGFDVTMPMIFSREAGKGTTAVHFVVMPFSAQKRDPARPGRWTTGVVRTGALALAGRRSRRASG
jgi:hypothetical protein